MPTNNPWYLITSDEIDTIKGCLHACGEPSAREDRVGEILQLLDVVRDRRP